MLHDSLLRNKSKDITVAAPKNGYKKCIISEKGRVERMRVHAHSFGKNAAESEKCIKNATNNKVFRIRRSIIFNKNS